MARLDVFLLPGGVHVVDVQAGLLDHLATRAAIPLLPAGRAPPPIQDLNPVFDIAGEPHVLLTQDIGSVPVRDLKRPVASLRAERDAITRALDILLIGF